MEVSASFLCNEPIKKTIETLNQSNTDYIHFDVMDGKFVNNKFLNPEELIESLKLCQKKKDVHLMVEDPKSYIELLKDKDIDYITIHYEVGNIEENIELIKQTKAKVGISIKPETKIEKIYPYLEHIDLVLIMSVNPGYSGQKFLDESENKIKTLRKEINKRNLKTKISVDGGIDDTNLSKIIEADIVVSSSYILKDLNNNINKIKSM